MKRLATWNRTSAIALAVIGLSLLGVGPSDGATLYGTARDYPGLLHEIDTVAPSMGIVLDLSLVTVDPPIDPVSALSPNGIALDAATERLYFASFIDPGSPADPSVPPSKLYFIDLLEPTEVHWAGTLAGHASSGTLFEGKYLYIDQGTDLLREVTLSAEGAVVSEVVVADLLTGNNFLVVDDLAADCTGLVYISASITDHKGQTKGPLHGTYDRATGVLTEFGSGWGELAFGDDGALWGHNGVTGDLFVIDPVTGATSAPVLMVETVNDLTARSSCTPSEPEPPQEAQVSLCAAQSYEAGRIALASDEENILVTFVANEGWNLAETHLAVECEAGQLPRSSQSGGPDLDAFPFQAVHDPLVEEYLYTVPLPDCGPSNVVYVAAHGLVYDMVNLQTAQIASGLIEAAVSDPDHIEVATKVTRRRRGQELLFPGGFEDPAAQVEPPQPAVLAWEPCDTYPDCPTTLTLDPSFWDTEVGSRPENPLAALSGADWIWEDYFSSDPVSGTVVRFERAFEVPGHAQSGDLYLTCRNAYEVYVNDQFVGMAQVPGSVEAGTGICTAASWQDSDLREACVSTSGWETLEGWLVGDLIRPGTNTLTIDAANEYFDIDDIDNLVAGTEASNPAGCIFTLWTDYASDNDPAWGAGCGDGDGYLFEGGDGATFFSYQTRAPNGGGGGDECGKVEQLYQWATGAGNKAAQWQFGNLNENNSTYFEDDTVPYYTHLTGLTVGNDYSLTIEWDTTKSSKHALDYLTTYNRSYLADDPCAEALGDCTGITPETATIPDDDVMTSDPNWDSTVGQVPGEFTIWNGSNPSAATTYGYSFDPDTCLPPASCYIGDTSTSITVMFTADAEEAVLAWGGHIATRMDWGDDNSAVFISGSPYHMRLIGYDDLSTPAECNVGNTDRSLKAAAVIFPSTITVVKVADPEGDQGFDFTFSEPDNTVTVFELADDGSSTSDSRLFDDLIEFDEYIIVEATPEGWDLDNIECTSSYDDSGDFTIVDSTATVNLREAEDVVCTYTNSMILGGLDVTKTVNWNGVTPVDPTTFEICIQGPSYPDAAACKTVTYPGALTASWTGLLPGAYVVTEPGTGAEWTVAITGSPATVPANGGTGTASVTNTRKLGGLDVTKTVNWNGVTPVDPTTFEICIQGPSYPDAAACKTVTYPGALTASWTGLLPGAYVVTEPGTGAEWTVAITGSPATVPANGGTGTASVTNTRKLGGLDVTKTVNWNGVTPVDPTTFEICIQGPSYPDAAACKTVTYPGALTASWTGLLPGAYVVTEPGTGAEWTVAITGSPATVPANGGTGTASVTNTRKLGGLDVTKTVNWNGVTPVDPTTFEICIQGPSYPDAAACKTVTYPGALTASWTGLLPGAYVVTEPGTGAEWTVAITGSPATVPANGGTGTASVTNTRKLGGLDVTKTVNWNGVTPVDPTTFEICIQGPSYPDAAACKTVTYPGALTASWTGLLPGAYVVTEPGTGAEWTVAITGSPATVPANGGTGTASVTNTRKLGGLDVTKTVNWNGVTPVDPTTFEICIQGPSYPDAAACKTVTYPGALTASWTGLLPGAYVVTEPGTGAEWTVAITGSPATVPANGGTGTASVTNTRKLGGLDVTKTVNWNGVTPVDPTTFEICIQGPSYPDAAACKTVTYPGALTASWTGLLPGAYVVTEPGTGAEWTVAITGSPATVPANGGTGTASVTNTRKLGGLDVTKTVNWNGVTPVDPTTFEICIQGPSYPDAAACKTVTYPGALTASWTGLLPGAYVVTEPGTGAEWTVAITGSPATVPANGGTGTASVTNTRKLGGLDVTKTVNWNGVTPVDPTTFEICIQGPSYPDAAACKTVTYPGALTASWTGLLPGAYVVTEPGTGAEWTVAITGSPATVPANGGTGTASVTNTRKLGGLDVTKTVNWNGVTPVDPTTFEICIQGPSYPDAAACKTVTYPGALTASWTGLLPGAYVVTEPGTGAEWTVAITGSPATVPANGGTGTASVTNTRKLGGLDVTKTVNWNGVTPVDPTTFEICIQGPSYPDAAACKTVTYPGALTASWTGLLPGAYVVTEPGTGAEWTVAITGSPATVPANGGTGTASVTNTRKLGGLDVTKTVNWNGVTPVDPTTFEICIQGPSYPDAAACKTVTYPGALTASWTGLLPGAYVVTEPGTGAEWTVAITGSPATVPANGGTGTASVTNTRKLGGLDVTKTVNWNGVTPVDPTTFEICIQGPSYPDAAACKTVTYPGALTASWTGLLPGAYVVTEPGTGAEWTVAITGSPATVPANGGTGTASVTNTRKLGGLDVTKTVNWNGVTPVDPTTFEICIQGPSYPDAAACKTVTYPGALTASWTGLLPGAYVVTEPGTGAEWTVAITGSPATVPANGGTGTASVTNTRKLGGLDVTKTVNWNGVTPVDPTTFEICIQGPSYPDAAACKTVTYPGALTASWTGLLPGAYVVTEPGTGAEWTVAITGSPATVPANGGTGTASVTNTRKLGGLDVTKTVNWNGVTPVDPTTFEICIQGPSYPDAAACKTVTYPGALTASWTGLLPGAYVVTEPGTGAEWTVAITGSPATVPANGGTGTASVTNTFAPGSITVMKVSNPDEDTPFQFALSGDATDGVTINGTGSHTFASLLPGSYNLAEVVPVVDWELAEVVCATDTGSTATNANPSVISLGAGGSVTCTFTNVASPPLPGLCIPNEIFAVDDPDRRNSIFFRIMLDGSGSENCGDFHNGANFEGLESLNSVLYAASGETDTDFDDMDGYFYTVAADTCAVTPIGPTGFTDVEALAIHPNDTMWGFAEDEGLFTIDDLDTAESTLRQASGTKIEALSWSLDGVTLYGAGDMNLYIYECTSGSLVENTCIGGGWQLVTDQLPGEIEGMDTVREDDPRFVPGQDVLILGAHSDMQLYYWNVVTGSQVGEPLSTMGHPDVEGVVVCKDD